MFPPPHIIFIGTFPTVLHFGEYPWHKTVNELLYAFILFASGQLQPFSLQLGSKDK